MMTAEIALTKMSAPNSAVVLQLTMAQLCRRTTVSQNSRDNEETSGKIIIWANYIQNIRDIEEALKKEYGDDTVVTYYGGTSADDRSRAIVDFQNPSSPVRFFTYCRRGILTKARYIF